MSGKENPAPDVSTAEKIQQQLSENLNLLTGFVDGGLTGASDVLKSTVAASKTEIERAEGLAKELYGTASDKINEVDATVISTLKQGVAFAVENETATIAATAALLVIVLPGPRRFLYRRTIGRFQSAEAVQKAAEGRLTALGENIDAQAGEAQKLAEQLAAAKEEYSRGIASMKSAASALRGLNRDVESTEKTAKTLMRDLRELRSKHALQMRSDLAVKVSAVGKQKSAVERVVNSLAKDGF